MNNAEIASENIKICSDKSYFADGERFSLPDGISRTVIYSPSKIEAILSNIDKMPGKGIPCEYEVNRLDTVSSALRELIGSDKVLALNFANATIPGGGYLRGASAQEEAICRQTTLYSSLSSPAASVVYSYNRQHDLPFGSKYVLLSPVVTAFRNDSMQLSPPAKPFAVITSAAPNLYGQACEKSQSAIDEAMKHKMRCLFAVALDGGYDTLILGAWGCGAFGHIAANVAGAVKEVLVDEGFDRFFGRIVFSVYVNPQAMETYNYNCFRKVFSPDKK